ncbi:MAG: hypothetical protein V1899_09105 [Planctomycetota bacterium]
MVTNAAGGIALVMIYRDRRFDPASHEVTKVRRHRIPMLARFWVDKEEPPIGKITHKQVALYIDLLQEFGSVNAPLIHEVFESPQRQHTTCCQTLWGNSLNEEIPKIKLRPTLFDRPFA